MKHTLFLILLLPFIQDDANNQEVLVLFNGISLDGWEIIDSEGHGSVNVADSTIFIEKGELVSGIRYTKYLPTMDYEVSLEAKRVNGSDFFCGLTFPVNGSFLTLVLGGWGGAMNGLSCINGYDAANNATGVLYYFANAVWYPIRLRVAEQKIEVWIGSEQIIDFTIDNADLSLRWEVEKSAPFGFTTYRTKGALRNIKVIKLAN